MSSVMARRAGIHEPAKVPCCPAACDQHAKILLVGQIEKNSGKGNIVFNDEKHGVAGLNQVAVIIDDQILDRDAARRQNRH